MGVTRLAAVLVLAGCGAAAQPTASLRLRGGAPPDATVTVDDQLLGSLALVSKRGVALPAGRHRVTVEKPGYFPWDRLVDAQGTPIQLDVELVRVPD